MKFRLFLPFLLIPVLISCGRKSFGGDESERKSIIDRESNELVETQMPDMASKLLNLDESLNELDLALRGEAGEISARFDETNGKISEMKERLRALETLLYDQAGSLKQLRLERVEPLLQETESDGEE